MWLLTQHDSPQQLTSTDSCDLDIFRFTYLINLFFKPPIFSRPGLSLRCGSPPSVWKVRFLAFIPATCQEWARSGYQTKKTVSCHLLKSQIHHPKISWSLSSTGNWHMRMKTAFYSEIIRQSCRSRRKKMCGSWRWAENFSLNLRTIKRNDNTIQWNI